MAANQAVEGAGEAVNPAEDAEVEEREVVPAEGVEVEERGVVPAEVEMDEREEAPAEEEMEEEEEVERREASSSSVKRRRKGRIPGRRVNPKRPAKRKAIKKLRDIIKGELEEASSSSVKRRRKGRIPGRRGRPRRPVGPPVPAVEGAGEAVNPAEDAEVEERGVVPAEEEMEEEEEVEQQNFEVQNPGRRGRPRRPVGPPVPAVEGAGEEAGEQPQIEEVGEQPQLEEPPPPLWRRMAVIPTTFPAKKFSDITSNDLYWKLNNNQGFFGRPPNVSDGAAIYEGLREGADQWLRDALARGVERFNNTQMEVKHPAEVENLRMRLVRMQNLGPHGKTTPEALLAKIKEFNTYLMTTSPWRIIDAPGFLDDHDRHVFALPVKDLEHLKLKGYKVFLGNLDAKVETVISTDEEIGQPLVFDVAPDSPA